MKYYKGIQLDDNEYLIDIECVADENNIIYVVQTIKNCEAIGVKQRISVVNDK